MVIGSPRKAGARPVQQTRLRPWQVKAFVRLGKKYNLNPSDISRFAINYLLLEYKGEITPDKLDNIEHEAFMKFQAGIA